MATEQGGTQGQRTVRVRDATTGEIIEVPVESLDNDPDNHPPQDEALISLLRDLSTARLTMYWAVIPLRYVRPFSPTYKPLNWEPWRQLLEQTKARIRENSYPP